MRRIAIALLLAGCAAPAATPPTTPAPGPAPTSLRVLPSRVLLEQGETLRFHAVDGDGRPVAVRWAVVQGTSEGPPTYDAGTVDDEGTYRPGVTGYWNHVEATAVGAPGVRAMALVQVVPVGGLPTGGEPEPREMSFRDATPEGASFRILHAPGMEQDAMLVSGWTRAALERLRRRFRREAPDSVWTEGQFTVELHPWDGRFTAGGAEVSTSWRDGVCTARVSFLAPSHHRGGVTTAAGLPFDEAYFRKLLVHEFSSVALEAATRMKPGGGWTIYDAPPWFVQGLEERIALHLGTTDEGRDGLARLRRIVRSDATRVAVEGGVLRLRDPYVDGTVFVEFLGTLRPDAGKGDPIRTLLLSTRPDFAAAFAEVFGADPAGLAPAFRDWLAGE